MRNYQLCIGDLGQSFDSNVTLAHYETNTKAQAVLFVGDLTYADNYPYHDNTRWDTWARFVERNLAYQPWIWTAGNHEIDFAPELVRINLLLSVDVFTVQRCNCKFFLIIHVAG
jgi:metallophosphoesterase superfamily enzyme